MKTVSILDCTLRDGGYINDWNFGFEAIRTVVDKLSNTGIECIEIGFIKGDEYDPNKSLFPNIKSFRNVLKKHDRVKYFGMLDVNSNVPLDRFTVRTDEDIDGIRVIFKQNKIKEGYEYCKELIKLGYLVTAQLVSTNTYSDEELIDTVQLFNTLDIYALSIVDSLGVIKKHDFSRIVDLINNNLRNDIALAYHSHNNLQQARSNAEYLVELSLDRDIIIDACVYGMGRGAGNLNLELFADYLNEYHGKNYRIEPMLEIIDEYLNDIYKKNFWGYSLPFYLSAKNGCHPNYAKYYNEKGTLTEKAFDELLRTISDDHKNIFSKEMAEKYYTDYMQNYIDDRVSIKKLSEIVSGKKVLIIGPGKTINEEHLFDSYNDLIKISIGFLPTAVNVDYIFCSNLRRYKQLSGIDKKILVTSNVKLTDDHNTLVFNYASYLSKYPSITDNSGIMLVKVLQSAGAKSILLAGLDGYSPEEAAINKRLSEINTNMALELESIGTQMGIKFITESMYSKRC